MATISAAVVDGAIRLVVCGGAKGSLVTQWGIEWVVGGKSHQVSGGRCKVGGGKTRANPPIVYQRVSPVRLVATGNTYHDSIALERAVSQARGRLVGRIIANEAMAGDDATPPEARQALAMLLESPAYSVPLLSME